MKSDDYQRLLGRNVVASVRKLSPPEVIGLPAEPKTHSTNNAMESSDMVSNESRSESHRTPVERSQNSSWEAPFKSE